MTTASVCRESVREAAVSVRGVYATEAMMGLMNFVAVIALTACAVCHAPVRGTERMVAQTLPRSI